MDKKQETAIKRTSQQVRQAIQGFWDGRDEMNLVEFPIALLSERAPSGVYTLEFSDIFNDWQNNRSIHRQVTIASTPKYGLPTAKDEEVLLGLLQLTKITNEFTDPRVEFSRYQLLELLGWKNEGPSYQRLVKAFDRWINTSMTYNNAWRDNNEKKWTNRRGFGFLDSYEFRDSRLRNMNSQQGTLPFKELHSEFRWNSVFFESIQAGYLKKLDYGVVRKLKRPAAKRLYRYLDKLFHEPNRLKLIFDLRTLCCEHLAMARSRETSHLRKDLQKAAGELELIGFLEPRTETERFRRVSRGVYEVAFEKKSIPIEQTSDPSLFRGQSGVDQSLYIALTDRGISREEALKLVTSLDYPNKTIEEKIAVHDWLIRQNDDRISINPSGYLLLSICKDYAVPIDFVRERDRSTTQEKASQLRQERIADNTKQQHDERAKNEAELEAVQKYLDALQSDKERAAFEKEALAASPLLRDMYEYTKNTDRHQFWRMEILRSYIHKYASLPVESK